MNETVKVGYNGAMKKLFDQAFFRFLLGFVVILAVSFSVLVVSGAYEDFKAGIAAAIKSVLTRDGGQSD